MLYRWHERIVYRPSLLESDYEFEFSQLFEEIRIPDAARDLTIHALLFPTPVVVPRGVVIYFHGNRGNLQRWGKVATDFTDYGYHILLIDYPGYGKSQGEMNEPNFYRSAELTYDWVSERLPDLDIIIYGRSLGSGPAAWLAARERAQHLILETPIPSIPLLFRIRASRALVPFTPRPKFPVESYLCDVSCPITIFHGTNDWVVPYRAAERLQEQLTAKDQFITIEGGSHNNLRSYPIYQRELQCLLTN